jgi:hypothetical protein
MPNTGTAADVTPATGGKLRVLDDYLDLEPFAREVNRHPRSVRRWLNQPDGLPFTRIGNRVLIHVPTARKWIFSRMRRPRRRSGKRGKAA